MFSERCLNSMRNYFAKGYTKNTNLRIAYLKSLYKYIGEARQELEEALYEDLGKCSQESYMTEIHPVLDEISYYIKNLKYLQRSKMVPCEISSFPSFAKIVPSPYGCVLIISPWNYPVNLTLKPLVSAIAAGNCAVVKPSEIAPSTALVLKKIVSKALPPTLCSMVLGGKDCAEQLLSLKFDYIFYTGSARIGRIVMASAAKNLTPLTLELGGKSPCIINDTKDMFITARRICWGKLLNSGQTCVAPDYVLIKRELMDEFIKQYRKCCYRFFGGNAIKNPKYPKIINSIHYDRLCSMLDQSYYVVGGRRSKDSLKIAPALVINPPLKSKIMNEEIFGPILPIIPYDTITTAKKIINSKPTPLALYIFSNEKPLIKHLTSTLRYGGCSVNDTISHIVNKKLPFGGLGESGFGSYNGKYGFETFSRKKSILYKKGNFDIPIKLPPYNKLKSSIIKLVVK